MFDPDEIRERQSIQKEAAKAKTQLPPLGGRHIKEAEVIDLSQLMDEHEKWLYAVENFQIVQRAYGLEIQKGVWVLVDKEKADRLRDPEKSFLREFLNEKRKLGKFQYLKPTEPGAHTTPDPGESTRSKK